MIGRDDERAVVAQFVSAAGARRAVLTIDGEAGIGKSTLLREAITVARAAGMEVLRTSPGEQESTLTFTGLTDLLATIDADAITQLPDPQRHAIAAATLRTDAGSQPLDQRAIGTGLANLLDALAASEPLIVAVDDLQWLDAPSLDALTFALRRTAARVSLLVCRRVSPDSSTPDLAACMPGDVWRDRIELGGLSLGATFVLVREQLGIALPRVRLARLWESSQGNPLLALELARAGGDRLADLPHQGLPLSDRLRHLLIARLASLSIGGRETCLALAAAGRATSDTLRPLDLERGVLEAEAAGIVTVAATRLSFSHPLLAEAALAAATESERRRMHARLADAVSDPEERARHLALADPSRSRATSAALDAAAAGAELRGAISAAIVLSRLAVERTPEGDHDNEWLRRISLARRLFQAGETGAALDALARRDTHCPPGRLRAEAELLIRDIAWVVHLEPAVALSAARNALAHAGDDPVLRARALVAELSCNPEGMDTLASATEARQLLESLPDADARLLATVRMTEVGCRCLAGHPVESDELWAIVARGCDDSLFRSTDEAMWVLPVLLRWIDDDHGALAALDELAQRADEEGNESAIPYVLGHRVSTLLELGRLREAVEAAERHIAHAEATRQDGQAIQGLLLLARVHAALGEFDAASAEAGEVRQVVSVADDPWLLASVAGVLGSIALRRGQHTLARDELERWSSENRRAGVAGPAFNHHYVDYVEAVLACGDRAAAGAIVEDLVILAGRARRPSAIAACLHARALVAAHDGNLEDALAHLDTLLAHDDRGFNAIARGRALVLQGTLHRRLKRKAAARASIEQARMLFDQTDARYWKVVADAELTRVGRRSADPLALTETERRIAELAAQGLTNRKVAERAFVSAKTVEANLARAYRKLGIRSRAELGAWMAASTSNGVT